MTRRRSRLVSQVERIVPQTETRAVPAAEHAQVLAFRATACPAPNSARRARCRWRPPRRGARHCGSAFRACAPPSGHNRAAAPTHSRTDRRHVRSGACAAWRSAAPACRARWARSAPSASASASSQLKKSASRINATLTASAIPARFSRAGSLSRKREIIDHREWRREGSEQILQAERR